MTTFETSRECENSVLLSNRRHLWLFKLRDFNDNWEKKGLRDPWKSTNSLRDLWFLNDHTSGIRHPLILNVRHTERQPHYNRLDWGRRRAFFCTFFILIFLTLGANLYMLTSKLFMIRKKFVAGQREKLENPKTIGFFSKEIITTLKLINNGLSVYSK